MSLEALTLAIAALSLAASLYVFLQQRLDASWGRQMEVAREDYSIMLDFYQSWLATDEQQCRKALYDARDAGLLFVDLSDEAKAQVNHAVATMNVVALLRSAARVPLTECDELFGSALVRVVQAAEQIGYFDWRASLTGSTPWPRLRSVAQILEQG